MTNNELRNQPRPALAIALAAALIGILASFWPRSRPQFQFPSQIQLGKWSLIKTTQLPIPATLAAIGQRYLYTPPICSSVTYSQASPPSNPQVLSPCTLQIDTYYIYALANSNLEQLLSQVYQFKLKELQPHQLPGQGFYIKFNQNQRQYLSSCINPQGEPTANSRQFLANRNLYDFNLKQIASYVLGLSDLRDKRCLWVVLSIPQAQGAELELTKAWQGWLNYWQLRFPN